MPNVNEYREELRVKVEDVNARLIRIETIIETGIPHIQKELERMNEHLKTLNGRTTKLEHWRTYLLGAFAVVSISMPFLIRWLG